jgi:glycerol-3-phosphate dehydrogenase
MRDRGLAALTEIAALTGEVLGWDEDRLAAEIESYTERARAEEDAEREPDDASAETVRLRTPDVAPLRVVAAS